MTFNNIKLSICLRHTRIMTFNNIKLSICLRHTHFVNIHISKPDLDFLVRNFSYFHLKICKIF